MDQLLNILNREEQPFLQHLALGKLLTTRYQILPLRLISPIVTVHEITRFKGYYVNPDKTIDIYGEDRVGINLDQFWKNLVLFDIYARPRRFLEKSPEGYRPRIFLDTKDNRNNKKNLILMPVDWADIQPGDIRFVSEDDSYQVTVVHVKYDIDTLTIHLINSFGELETETYKKAQLKDWGDYFYTIIRL